MIIDEPINRFASNFGVMPNSIALKHDWTTPFDAVNIENAGPVFDEESDFGNGLTGISNGISNGVGNILTEFVDLMSSLRSRFVGLHSDYAPNPFTPQSKALPNLNVIGDEPMMAEMPRKEIHSAVVQAMLDNETANPNVPEYVSRFGGTLRTYADVHHERNPSGEVGSGRLQDIGLPVAWREQLAEEFAQNESLRGVGVGSFTDILAGASVISWGLVAFGGYAVYQALTKSEPAKKRKSAISRARADLAAAKRMSRWHD